MRFCSLLAFALGAASLSMGSEPMPARLAGAWTITHILPTRNTACWDQKHAEALLGTRLEYKTGSMRWSDQYVPLHDVIVRSVSDVEFRQEGGDLAPTFKELGIHAPRVTEIDLQHDDADITGATTEVPGDTILLVGSNRIVVTACGVYYEAIRAASAKPHH
jgi:hypothetical protein